MNFENIRLSLFQNSQAVNSKAATLRTLYDRETPFGLLLRYG